MMCKRLRLVNTITIIYLLMKILKIVVGLLCFLGLISPVVSWLVILR